MDSIRLEMEYTIHSTTLDNESFVITNKNIKIKIIDFLK